MAENLKKDGEKPKTRKEKRQGPGMGHNLTELRKKAEPAVKAILKLFADKESDNSGWMADINNAYESHSEKLGMTKSFLRDEIARIRRRQKEEARELEMESEERAEREAFRAAMEGTPFGRWADGTLAEPKKGE